MKLTTTHGASRRALLATVFALLTYSSSIAIVPAAQATAGGWVTAWGSALQRVAPLTASNFTCRYITRVSVGGSAVRLRISNVFNPVSTTFNKITVAVRSSGGNIVSGSSQAVSFGGVSSLTLTAGAETRSDLVQLGVTAGEDLAVSFYLAGAITSFSSHDYGFVSNYCTSFAGSAGDHTGDLTTASFGAPGSVMAWLTGVDVDTTNPANAVVALGDSITDGVGTSTDQYARWPDVLTNRIQALSTGNTRTVVNEGIGGNMVVATGGAGPSAVDRFSRDVLQQAGIHYVIIFEGTNDIAGGSTSAFLIQGLQQLVNSARTAGVVPIGATLIPRRGGWGGDDDAKDAIRATVNNWIRTSGVFNAVLDFDAVVKNTNPNYPTPHDANFSQYINATYDYDHVHLNATGYAAVANSIDLSVLGVTSAGPTGSITGPGSFSQCLDVNTNTGVNGNAIQLWTCNGVQGQQWTMNTNGTVQSFGKCLDIVGNGTANLTKVELWTCNGVGGQQWRPQPNGSLLNPQSGRCLDDPGGNTANGTQLQIYDCNGLWPQFWKAPV